MDNKGKKCARNGCENIVQRNGAKYCCGDCKMIVDLKKRRNNKKQNDKNIQTNKKSN